MQNDSTLLWSIDVIQCTALILLLIFHLYRMQKLRKRNEFNGGVRLCKVIQLTHVSFMIIITSLFKPMLSMGVRVSDAYFNFLDGNMCNIIENTYLISALISHFGIHLFIAMRSRMSSTDIENPSIFFKLGLVLVSTDILLIIYPFLFTAIQTAHTDGSCIIVSKSLFFIIWIVIQDAVIGIYSLCVFVIPLKKLISWEQHHSKASKTDLRSLVYKVIICSTIMIFSTMLSMTMEAIFSPTLSTLAPTPFIINSYCVVLQFAEVDVKDIESSYCQIIIGVVQCSCFITECHRKRVDKSVEQNDPNISKMVRSLEVIPCSPRSVISAATTVRVEVDQNQPMPRMTSKLTIAYSNTADVTSEGHTHHHQQKSSNLTPITPQTAHIMMPTPSDLPSLRLTPVSSVASQYDPSINDPTREPTPIDISSV